MKHEKYLINLLFFKRIFYSMPWKVIFLVIFTYFSFNDKNPIFKVISKTYFIWFKHCKNYSFKEIFIFYSFEMNTGYRDKYYWVVSLENFSRVYL